MFLFKYLLIALICVAAYWHCASGQDEYVFNGDRDKRTLIIGTLLKKLLIKDQVARNLIRRLPATTGAPPPPAAPPSPPPPPPPPTPAMPQPQLGFPPANFDQFGPFLSIPQKAAFLQQFFQPQPAGAQPPQAPAAGGQPPAQAPAPEQPPQQAQPAQQPPAQPEQQPPPTAGPAQPQPPPPPPPPSAPTPDQQQPDSPQLQDGENGLNPPQGQPLGNFGPSASPGQQQFNFGGSSQGLPGQQQFYTQAQGFGGGYVARNSYPYGDQFNFQSPFHGDYYPSHRFGYQYY